MRNPNAVEKQTMRHILLTVCVAALAVALMVALPQSAHAAQITLPDMPPDLQVPEGNVAYLVGHAVGTQNYICLPSTTSPSDFAFALFTPQATLFDDQGKQIITHFFSPNPHEPGSPSPIRATWQSSDDTSTVWAQVADPTKHSSTDPKFVEPDAVAWLLLTVVGSQDGPDGGDTLTGTTFVQRLNTSGGVAPSAGCASKKDIGNKAFVPYTADYFFYRDSDSQ